jgi:hypothetical protein
MGKCRKIRREWDFLSNSSLPVVHEFGQSNPNPWTIGER